MGLIFRFRHVYLPKICSVAANLSNSLALWRLYLESSNLMCVILWWLVRHHAQWLGALKPCTVRVINDRSSLGWAPIKKLGPLLLFQLLILHTGWYFRAVLGTLKSWNWSLYKKCPKMLIFMKLKIFKFGGHF